MAVTIQITPTLGFAAPQTFKLDRGTVKLEIPAEWEAAPDFMGMPLAILGPQVDEERPTVSVIPMGVSSVTFDPTDLKKQEASYKTGREEWLAKNEGKSIAFLPYSEAKLNSKATRHTLAFRYEMDGDKFIEQSHYISCNQKLYLVKTSVNEKQESSVNKTLDKMIASFTCE